MFTKINTVQTRQLSQADTAAPHPDWLKPAVYVRYRGIPYRLISPLDDSHYALVSRTGLMVLNVPAEETTLSAWN